MFTRITTNFRNGENVLETFCRIAKMSENVLEDIRAVETIFW
jgi:hypothetical protein